MDLFNVALVLCSGLNTYLQSFENPHDLRFPLGHDPDKPFPATLALVEEADTYAAPFTKTGLDRIHSSIFGSKRVKRSSNVIVLNLSERDFDLSKNACTYGQFSSGFFPEKLQPPKSTTAYRIESTGFMAGATCSLEYRSDDQTWFTITVSNPYIGHNYAEFTHSDNLKF